MAVKIDVDIDIINTFLLNILDLNKKITSKVEISSKLVQRKLNQSILFFLKNNKNKKRKLQKVISIKRV